MNNYLNSIDEIIHRSKACPKQRLVVAVAQDPYVLDAVKLAFETLTLNVTLIGDEQEIRELLLESKVFHPYEIMDIKDKAQACIEAAKLVHSGYAHILMKGLVDTSILLKAVLDKTHGLKTEKRLSHVSLIENSHYPKLFMISDAAMNMYPDVEIKKDIILNGVDVLHRLGIMKPNVGILAAIEKENPKMPATIDAILLKKMNEDGIIANCIVDGPFALDNALSKEAAVHKGVTSPIAGDVDFLLVPTIDAGNILYKSLMFLSNSKSASVVYGASAPIVVTSRADGIMTKYASIALAKLLV